MRLVQAGQVAVDVGQQLGDHLAAQYLQQVVRQVAALAGELLQLPDLLAHRVVVGGEQGARHRAQRIPGGREPVGGAERLIVWHLPPP